MLSFGMIVHFSTLSSIKDVKETTENISRSNGSTTLSMAIARHHVPICLQRVICFHVRPLKRGAIYYQEHLVAYHFIMHFIVCHYHLFNTSIKKNFSIPNGTCHSQKSGQNALLSRIKQEGKRGVNYCF